MDLILQPPIKDQISEIAKKYGFTKIMFDTEYPYEGFRRYYASTLTPSDITYRYLFLNPASQFYSISNTLFRKATEVLTLHERTHHLSPFNSNPDVNDWLVEEQACKEYSNQLEYIFLDVLTSQFCRIKYLNDNEIRSEVSQHVKKYTWINENEREGVVEQLGTRRNYKLKNLKQILSNRNIIPLPKSSFMILSERFYKRARPNCL